MITNEKHLYHILKTPKARVEYIIENIDNYYHSFTKEKKNARKKQGKLSSDDSNEKRILFNVSKKLKKIQQNLYIFFKNNAELPEYAFGGIQGRNNIKNARYHQGNKYVFTTDIKSFFPNISNKQVFDMFLREGCTPSIARILTKLTTYSHQLPQGASTSTIIANLVFKPCGKDIELLAQKHNIKFSTFVDDITLSSKSDFKDIAPIFIKIISKHGFKINHKKTCYKTKNPLITGIVCHNDRLLPPLSCKRRIAQLKKDVYHNPNVKEHLTSLVNYIKNIQKSNH